MKYKNVFIKVDGETKNKAINDVCNRFITSKQDNGINIKYGDFTEFIPYNNIIYISARNITDDETLIIYCKEWE